MNASPAYKAVHVFVNWFFKTFYDFSASGVHHVPLTGSIIIAANHASFYDPPVIGSPLPRHLNYFARDTLFKGLLGKIISSLDTIPVNRNAADIKSLKAIFKALKNKGAIVIFPEGSRSSDGTLSKPKSGVGMIACKSQTIVIPARIFGSFEVFGRQQKLPALGGPIDICFGPPMAPGEFDPGQEHSERYDEASRRIMNAIAKLKSPEQIIV